MLSFKEFLKAMLPEGSLWNPVEPPTPCPEPEYEDADMEALTTAAWSSHNATLSKSTTTPYEGLRSLRVLYAAKDPYAYQVSLTAGCRYHYIVHAKVSGNYPTTLYVANGSTVIWSHVFTDANWQECDVYFTAYDPEIRLGSDEVAPIDRLILFDDSTLEVIQPANTAYFDLTLDCIGQTQETSVYSFLKNLAYIRDPWLTPYLSDLEKEYGVVTDLTITENERRAQLAAIVFAPRGSGSWDDLEDILNTAGFAVEIRTNDPEVNPGLPTLVASELIANGTELDLWINYLVGLSDSDRWNYIFWIVASSSGWPYIQDGFIHTQKNNGDLLLYNNYLTESVWDYSKFRYENIRATDVTFDSTGATFGLAGRILVDYAPRYQGLEGALAFSGALDSHTDGERLYSKKSASNLSLEIYLATGPDRIIIEDESVARSINYSLSTSTPDTIVINFKDGFTPTLYADGVLIGSFSGALNMTQYTQNWHIGNDYTYTHPLQSVIKSAITSSISSPHSCSCRSNRFTKSSFEKSCN
jgi:hypothetical protein